MTKLSSLLIPTICSLAFASPVDKKPVHDGKGDESDRVGGFFLYRRWSDRIEYLLLKKTDEDNWSPPKGNSEEHEPEFATAVRETGEETGLYLSKGDYETFKMYRISFEYETDKGVHKAVSMWRAKLKNHEKPIRLSEEDEAYSWLEYDAAIRTITPPYQDGLRAANNIIHDYEFKKKPWFTINIPIPIIEINAHH